MWRIRYVVMNRLVPSRSPAIDGAMCDGTMGTMPVIHARDIEEGRRSFTQWREAAIEQLEQVAGLTVAGTASAETDESSGSNESESQDAASRRQSSGTKADNQSHENAIIAQSPADLRLRISPRLPRRVWAMAVRYTLHLLQAKAPGPGVEVRVAPWGAVKILDGPASDPHNLTPPDVIELEPAVWMRLASGITAWDEERAAGRVTAVGERDDLSALLPLA